MTVETQSESNEGRLPPQQIELRPNQLVRIDGADELMSREQTTSRFGVNGRVFAEVRAADQSFYLADVVDDPRFAGRYIAMGDMVMPPSTDSTGWGFRYLLDRTWETFGRGQDADRFQFSERVSNNHFQVLRFEDHFLIRNLDPKNGTELTGWTMGTEPANEGEREVAGRTEMARQRVVDSPNYRPPDAHAAYGYYHDLPILGRDMREIDGGVYLGGSSREAIVVDGGSEALQNMYNQLLDQLTPKHGQKQPQPLNLRQVLEAVKGTVAGVMEYSEERTEELSAPYHGDQLVNLSQYVEAGTGVCRHQGLMAAYLVEKLIQDDMLQGEVAVERNTVPELGGTHAWAVYKVDGETYVIDPAQGFMGTKEEARQQKKRWEYTLDTDLSYLDK